MANLAFSKDIFGDNYEVLYVQSAATLDDGEVVVATTLSTVYGEGDVYTATTPVANTDGDLVMVLGEEFYQDAFGNRINITDPTKIDYPAGTIVRAVRPNTGRRFAISSGAYTGTPVLAQYLIPTAGAKTWAASATIPASVKFALKVDFIGNISSKGNTPIAGVVARVVTADAV